MFHSWLTRDLGDTALKFEDPASKEAIIAAKWIREHIPMILSKKVEPDMQGKLAILILLRLLEYKKSSTS